MHVHTIGLDLAKHFFRLAASAAGAKSSSAVSLGLVREYVNWVLCESEGEGVPAVVGRRSFGDDR